MMTTTIFPFSTRRQMIAYSTSFSRRDVQGDKHGIFLISRTSPGGCGQNINSSIIVRTMFLLLRTYVLASVLLSRSKNNNARSIRLDGAVEAFAAVETSPVIVPLRSRCCWSSSYCGSGGRTHSRGWDSRTKTKRALRDYRTEATSSASYSILLFFVGKKRQQRRPRSKQQHGH